MKHELGIKLLIASETELLQFEVQGDAPYLERTHCQPRKPERTVAKEH